MLETAILNTNTIVTVKTSSPNLEVFTYYNDLGIDFLSCFISEENSIIFSNQYDEGELVAVLQNFPQDIDLFLNPDTGELTLFLNDQKDDVNNYSIDPDTGELKYQIV